MVDGASIRPTNWPVTPWFGERQHDDGDDHAAVVMTTRSCAKGHIAVSTSVEYRVIKYEHRSAYPGAFSTVGA